MKNKDIHSFEIDESLFEAQLDVPDASALKLRILELTEGMPPQMARENLADNVQVKDKVSFISKFFEAKFFAPFAVAASVALMAVLWFPSSLNQTETISDVVLSEESSVFTLEDDLEFEETMIYLDEQMFAQL